MDYKNKRKRKEHFPKNEKEIDIIAYKLIENDEFLYKVVKRILREGLLKTIDKEEKIDNNINKNFNIEKGTSTYINKKSVNKEFESLKNQIDDKNKKIKELNSEIEQLNNKIDEIDREREIYIGNYKKLEDKYDKLESKNINLNKEIEDLNLCKENNKITIEKLKRENSSLGKQKQKLKDEYEGFKLSVQNNLNVKNEEIRKKENCIIKYKKEISLLQNEFSSIKKAYNLFLNMDNTIKNDISEILKGDSIENFVYAGVQYKNIEAIWEYAKTRAIYGQFEDLEKIEEIIKKLLEAHNKIYKSSLYEMQEVNIGEEIDEEKFIRGYESKLRGSISHIDLLGYINLATGRIVKKSVVRV